MDDIVMPPKNIFVEQNLRSPPPASHSLPTGLAPANRLCKSPLSPCHWFWPSACTPRPILHPQRNHCNSTLQATKHSIRPSNVPVDKNILSALPPTCRLVQIPPSHPSVCLIQETKTQKDKAGQVG